MTRPAVLRAATLITLGLVLAVVTSACTSSAGASPGVSASPSVRPGPSFSPRPTVVPTAAPVTGEVPQAVMDAVVADLSTRTAADATAATVVTAEAVEWPDGALGCPEMGMMYTQQITPGYQVVLSLDGTEYDYRVAGEAESIRLCEGLRPAGAG